MSTTTPQPTKGQAAAVVWFARAHGRRWRMELNIAWSEACASVRATYRAELQQLRNDTRFGPLWLRRVKLADMEAIVDAPPAAETPAAAAQAEREGVRRSYEESARRLARQDRARGTHAGTWRESLTETDAEADAAVAQLLADAAGRVSPH